MDVRLPVRFAVGPTHRYSLDERIANATANDVILVNEV